MADPSKPRTGPRRSAPDLETRPDLGAPPGAPVPPLTTEKTVPPPHRGRAADKRREQATTVPLQAAFAESSPDTVPGGRGFGADVPSTDPTQFEGQLSTGMENDAMETTQSMRPRPEVHVDLAHAQLNVLLGAAAPPEEGKRLHKLLDRMLERRALGGPPTREQLDVFKELLARCTDGSTTGAEADRVLATMLARSGEGVVRVGGRGAVALPDMPSQPMDGADVVAARPQRGEPTLIEAPPSAPDDEPPTQEARRRPSSPQAAARPMTAAQLRLEARQRLDHMLPADVSALARERLLGILDRFAEARAVGARVLDPDAAVADLMSSLRLAMGTRATPPRELDGLLALMGVDPPR